MAGGRIDDIVSKEALKQINDLNKALDTTLDTMAKLSKEGLNLINTTGRQADSNSKLNKEQKDTTTNNIKQQIEEEKLNQLIEKGTRAREAAINKRKQLTDAEKEALKVAKDKGIIDDKEAGTLEKIAAKTRLLKREKESLKLETVEGRKRQKEINEELDRNTKIVKENSDALGKQKMGIGGYKDAIMGAFAAVTAAIAGASFIIEGFKKVIGSVQSLSDSFQANMAGMKTASDAFFTTIATGDFSNLIGNLTKAYKAGKEYAQILDELDDKNRALSTQEADASVKLAKLTAKLKDRSKGEKERAELAKQAIAIEDTIAKKKIANANEAYQGYLKQLSATKGLSKVEIERFITDYENNNKLVEQGEEYNLLLRRQKELSNAASFEGLAEQKQVKEAIANTTDEVKYYSVIAKGVNKITDEERAKFVELYNTKTQAVAEFTASSGRLESRMNSLLAKDESDANKESIKNTKETEKAKTDIRANEKANQIQLLNELEAIIESDNEKEKKSLNDLLSEVDKLTDEELKIIEEAAKKYLEIANTKAEHLQSAYEKQLELAETSGGQITEIEKETLINSLKLIDKHNEELRDKGIITDEEYIKRQKETAKEVENIETAVFEGRLERMQFIGDKAKEFGDLLTGLSGALAEREIQDVTMKTDTAIAEIDRQANAEIEATGGNAEEKNKIQAAAELKKRKLEQDTAIEIGKIRRKQAIIEKANALAQIAINGALAQIKIWAEVPKVDFGVSTIILSSLAGVATAAALATAAIQPLPEIPKFAKGTKSSPQGLAWVGEKGVEMGILPSGEKFITPNKATLTYLPKGTEIVPNHVIKKDLQQMNSWNMIPNEGWNGDKRIGELIDIVRNKKEVHLSIDKHGLMIAETQYRNATTFLNNKFRR
jgi:hypothetical protein